MTEIGVVHLVRRQNGLAPFRAFLHSYRAHPAGSAHDLVIVFKGFTPPDDELPDYQALLGDLPHRALFMLDDGFDIGAYLSAARQLEQHYLCFLNSFSVLLADDWLAKLYRHVQRPGVGVVGATGSFESAFSGYVRAGRAEIRTTAGWRMRVADEFYRVRHLLRLWRDFSPFPNYHLRTNAFMLPRRLMLQLRVGALARKREVEQFESGRHGLTRQLSAMRLDALVVGRDGRAYAKEEWPASGTFRSDEQRNLLVADNRTRQYIESAPAFKQLLAEVAWGAEQATI